jgi:hypothetical protein
MGAGARRERQDGEDTIPSAIGATKAHSFGWRSANGRPCRDSCEDSPRYPGAAVSLATYQSGWDSL